MLTLGQGAERTALHVDVHRHFWSENREKREHLVEGASHPAARRPPIHDAV
jgi:hypothetical protein